MTDETKKLFDAPWHSNLKEDYVEDAKGFVIAKCLSNPITNCFSHLPELYDALMDLLYTGCVNCYSATYQLMAHDAAPTIEFFLENSCPKGQRDCSYNKAWRLIKNVRDGK